MTEHEILSRAAEIVTDKSEVVEIPIEPKNRLDRLLMRLGLRKASRTFHLRKILVGNRYRIAAKAVKLPESLFKDNNIVRLLFEGTYALNDDLLYIAAVTLQNDRYEPSHELIDMLRWVDDSVLFDILDKGLNMVDVQSFMNSIVLIKGTQVTLTKETSLN